jgi:hypothetical protein
MTAPLKPWNAQAIGYRHPVELLQELIRFDTTNQGN